MLDYIIQERVDLFVKVGSVHVGCLLVMAVVNHIPCSMLLVLRCCLLGAELQLLHDIGLTTASAAWLLFIKVEAKGASECSTWA